MGPQSHLPTVLPAAGEVHVAPAVVSVQGFSFTPVVTPEIFCELTVTLPEPSVATEATYLLVADADSQPHAFALGREPVADWTTSVIVVRQADAANTTSDILARRV